MHKATVGSVKCLAPPERLVPLLKQMVEDKRKERESDPALRQQYYDGYEAWMSELFTAGKLAPLHDADEQQSAYLAATLEEGGPGWPVEDGDALLCTCSRKEAAAGRCHRAWAAPWLERAGWKVVLE